MLWIFSRKQKVIFFVNIGYSISSNTYSETEGDKILHMLKTSTMDAEILNAADLTACDNNIVVIGTCFCCVGDPYPVLDCN